jgi:hypothetical protein
MGCADASTAIPAVAVVAACGLISRALKSAVGPPVNRIGRRAKLVDQQHQELRRRAYGANARARR